jgi:hypothetical protein
VGLKVVKLLTIPSVDYSKGENLIVAFAIGQSADLETLNSNSLFRSILDIRY